ncbi:hypothetical protein MKW92_034927, partial [Papaver armeniacum]
ENAKIDEQFADAPPGEIDSQPFKIASYNEVGVSVEQGGDENEGYDVETSSLGSHAEIESGTGLHHLPTNTSKEQEETTKLRLSPEDVRCTVGSSASASSHERLEDLIVEDSPEENIMMVKTVRCLKPLMRGWRTV